MSDRRLNWRIIFRWMTHVGFWWSLVALAYSMRTPKLALEKLSEWVSVVAWLLSPLYQIWAAVRDAFLFITAPLYYILPLTLTAEVRDALSFGFFLGLRVLPIAFKNWVATAESRPDWAQALGTLGGIFFIMMGLPYLLASDHAGTWLSGDAAEMWVFGFAFEVALGVGILVWLAIDPFHFVSRQSDRAASEDQ